MNYDDCIFVILFVTEFLFFARVISMELIKMSSQVILFYHNMVLSIVLMPSTS